MKINLLSRLRSFLGFLALYSFTALICLPFMPRVFDGFTLDTSWLLSLHHFYTQGLIFGKDIIFTFGPYGFLFTFVYHPSTYELQLIAYASLLLIFNFNLWNVFRIQHSRTQTILLMTIFFFCGSLWFRLTDFFYLSIFIAAYFLGPRLTLLRTLLWAISLALLSLIKFVSFPITAITLLLVGLDQMISRRRLPWIWAFYVVSLFYFWALIGHPTEGLFTYLINSLEITTGYGSSMAKYGHPANFLFIGLYFLWSCFILYLVLRNTIKQKFTTSLFHLITLTFFLFACYRYAFTRADFFHVLSSLGAMLGISTLYFPLLTSFFECRKRIIAVLALLIGTVIICTLFGPDKRPLNLLSRIIRNAQFVVAPQAARETLNQEYIDYNHKIQAKNPVSSIHGTIDTFPHDQAILLSHELKYEPRPIFQSYSAYTQKLIEINAQHMRSNKAPEFVLFRIDPIDRRYPSQDGSLTWLELLTRYKLKEKLDEHILLEKADTALPYTLNKGRVFKGSYGDTIQLSETDGTLIWVEIDFKKTLAYPFITLFTAPVLPDIEILQGKSQSTQFHRLAPEITKVGFLLSPLVSFTSDFATILENRNLHNLPPVHSFRIWRGFNLESLLSRAMYKPEFEIRLYSLELDT